MGPGGAGGVSGEVVSDLVSDVGVRLVEEHLFHFAASVSGDSSLCYLVRMTAVCVVLMNHSWVSFHCRLHLCMPRKLNTPLLLFSDLSPRFFDYILRFLYSGAQKPTIGYFRHTQFKAHVELFELYSTSSPCHCAGILKTYKKLVAASSNEIWQ